jgi:Fe-S oxidoreductase
MRLAIGLVVIVASLAIALRRALVLAQVVRSGPPAPGHDVSVGRRAEAEVVEVLGQRRLLAKRIPGLAHFFTFWGFTILLVTVVEAVGALFDRHFSFPIIGHEPWLGALEDTMALLVLVALVVFAVIRIREAPARRERSSRFYGSHTGVAWLTLLWIAAVILTLLAYRATQVNDGDFPYRHGAWLSELLAAPFRHMGPHTNYELESVFLVANVAVIFAFLMFIVHSKHLHIFTAPLNVAFARRPRALGALATTPNLDPESLDETTVLGIGTVGQLTWKARLDTLACTECGRCQELCPAWGTGKPLSPKLLIMSLREAVLAGARDSASRDRALVPDVVPEDVLWACTTCGACVAACPVDIEHVDTIIEMRRYQVLMESAFPSEAGGMLRNLENQGDPWGLGQRHRLDWLRGLEVEVPVFDGKIPDDIEVLLWVGCAGALDERAQATTRATATLLARAGVRFGILGPRETCTGDPARRMGNEYLFQMQAQQVIETLTDAGARRIVTACPHCFNTMRNEYPALGGSWEVVHHSELLASLVAEGRLEVDPGSIPSATYHDSCYLGRHNGVYEAPRAVVSAALGAAPLEMERSGSRSFCCGAGGARMWMEEAQGQRVNAARVEQALDTGAEVVGVACPFCMIMLDDGLKTRQASGEAPADVRVADISQLLVDALRTGSAPRTASAED